MTNAFDFAPLLRVDLPPAAVKFTGVPPFNFTGGHNDPDELPLDSLVAAANSVLSREGRTLSSYGFATSGPQGYRPLREFLVRKLKRDAGIECTIDNILLTSGSLQGLELVNGIFLQPGDTVVVERDNYQGTLNRLTKAKANVVGIPLDSDGMRMDALASALADLKSRGVRPKFIYTIPTVHNPTGSILPQTRRVELLKLAQDYGVAIFEDDCYADLIWDGKRPLALYAMSKSANVVHIGSFSKSIAPALRVGYVVAPWELMSRMLPLKTDAGSGAIEQMVLSEYCFARSSTR
jgi:2-aminoadipate transaminase